jgi:putative alpha-1,2-mannosidase
MKIVAFVYSVLLSTVLFGAKSPTSYVDPFIGTAGDFGQLDPAATLPFGMIKLGPDTEPLNHSGYNYNADKIIGFSHNRLPGVGCSGAGGFLRIKPGVGKMTAKAESYIKESEKASVGYYAVTFKNKISAELTASSHVGWHRYVFPKSEQSYVAIDINSTFAEFINSDYKIINGKEIVGYIEAKNNCNFGRVKNYLSIVADKKIEKVVEKDKIIYLVFSTEANEQVELQAALSPISIEQARADRIVDCDQKNFELVRKNAESAWNALLSRIYVEGKEEYKKIFYTHLYHSYLMPVNSTSPGGVYQYIKVRTAICTKPTAILIMIPGQSGIHSEQNILL